MGSIRFLGPSFLPTWVSIAVAGLGSAPRVFRAFARDVLGRGMTCAEGCFMSPTLVENELIVVPEMVLAALELGR
jgi:hypothetical protein